MKLLVISDLHIGKRARTRELCPYAEGNEKDEKLVSSFLTYIQEYIADNGLFDYLILPGDITHQSNLIEYQCGQKFLEQVLSQINLSKDKVIFVPGNHDVDWSVLEGKTIYPEEIELRKSHKYNAIKDKRHAFSSFVSPELMEDPFIKKWEYGNAIFFGFNSSWHDDSLNKNHFGLIEVQHVDKLKRALDSSFLEDKIKFFVVHHHLYQYPNPHPRWTDMSCMQNAQLLIELLSEYSFNFVIHGHRHVPNFLTTSINGHPPINLLCAGSYSCEVPSDIAGSIGNVFHIIEIDDLKKCKGQVLSFAYDPTRYVWTESKANHGISYKNPFGLEITYEKLLEQCTEKLDTLLKSDKDFIYYSKLIEQIPDLAYIPNNLKQKLFSDFDDRLNITNGKVADEKLILLKR